MDFLANIDLNMIIDFIGSPSFQNLQLAAIVYVGLLWLSIIIWVTRDIIHRSESLIFQVIAILLNLIFPLLGVLIYLIIRPSKTTIERYYEDLENRFILEAIEGSKEKKESPQKKVVKKKVTPKKLKPKTEKK